MSDINTHIKMNIWFEVGVQYVKVDENGRERKAKETYLLDAISFGEAESRIYKELQTMISGEFIVTRIAKTRISEIIPSDNGSYWYKAKVRFITLDEETGKEKRTEQFMLVYSETIKEAYDQIIEVMKGMMCDFQQPSISESNIYDVFPYSAAEKTELPPHLKPIEAFLEASKAIKEDE